MYTVTPLCDMNAAYDFYHTYSAADPSTGKGSADTQDPLRLMPVSPETITYWFAGDDRVTLGAYDGNCLIGIASGVIAAARGTGFLSYVCVSPEHRRQGVATALCDELEARLLADPAVKRLDAVFHNPVHLPWYIPGGAGDWHPCLPGVDKVSGLYLFLKNRGWRDFAHQNAYYRRMADYTDKPAIAVTRARLLGEGIELTLYDPARHYGLPELFDNIQNPGWKAHVLAHTDRPIVVAVDHHTTDAEGRALIVSYTGPLSLEGAPARGGFCGIGTRTEYRGRGIGKPVFCSMCAYHRDGLPADGGTARGADFMSLYTGEDNPARNIYESAGFKVVRSFADMRK